MMKRSSKHNAGFTMIETILVIVVLGIASYGVLTVFIQGLRGSANPVKGVQAVELAKEKLETVLADKHDTAKGYVYLTGANYPAETPVSGFTGFNRQVSFQEVDGTDLSTASAGSGFKKVTVTVSWDSTNVTLESIVTYY